tara:strand:+ start:63 stop:572 length:510 start_codon:yes stop_codon:yes gene_type:complete
LKKSLVLTGMMGVGKTTIGILLSKRIKFRFVDIDTLIEKKERKSIKQIFEKKGENYFRKIEQNESLRHLKREKIVLALGGGAFINNKIRKEVLKNSISFWLDINVENLIKRKIIVKKRPLLSGNNFKKTLTEIYTNRKSVYDLADFRIDCNKFTKEQVVKKIFDIYENL